MASVRNTDEACKIALALINDTNLPIEKAVKRAGIGLSTLYKYKKKHGLVVPKGPYKSRKHNTEQQRQIKHVTIPISSPSPVKVEFSGDPKAVAEFFAELGKRS